MYVSLVTDRFERVAPGARLLAGSRWLTVVESRQQQQRWLVRFEGVDDRTAAEKLTNTTLLAEPLPVDAVDDDDALWVHDLIGSRVIDVQGVDRGMCIAVIDNPAARHPRARHRCIDPGDVRKPLRGWYYDD